MSLAWFAVLVAALFLIAVVVGLIWYGIHEE